MCVEFTMVQKSKNGGSEWNMDDGDVKYECCDKAFVEWITSQPGPMIRKTFTEYDDNKYWWDNKRNEWFTPEDLKNCPQMSSYSGTYDQLVYTDAEKTCDWVIKYWKETKLSANIDGGA